MMTSSIECPLEKVGDLIEFVDGTFDRDFLVGKVNKPTTLHGRTSPLVREVVTRRAKRSVPTIRILTSFLPLLRSISRNTRNDDACDGRENEQSDRADRDHKP